MPVTMPVTDLDDRLAKLPDPLPTLLRDAIAISREVGASEYDEALDAREKQAWSSALRSAGFDEAPGYEGRVIPLASELSELQRSVVELLAHVPGLPLNDWPIYAGAWLRRRWLGIDPPGVLFAPDPDDELARPRLHVLRELARDDEHEELRRRLDGLSLAERAEFLVDLTLAPLDLELVDDNQLIEAVTLALAERAVDPNDASWARALADRLIDAFDQPEQPGERPNGAMPELIARMAMTALLAAGVELEPRHDALLRLGWGNFEALALRSIAAIPEARREAAVLAALDRQLFPNYEMRVAAMVLRRFPLPEVAHRAVALVPQLDNPASALELLERIAEAQPSLAELFAEHRRSLPEVPRLRLGQVLERVTLDDLDEVRRRQLELANERYGGQTMSAEQILAQGEDETDGETISPSFLQLRTILDDEGAPAYDAWLYNVDSGTVFVAGTEEVAAEVIQFGVETAHPGLRIALPGVLEASPKKAAKKGGKKGAGKKAAKKGAKKAAAKKGAKKAAAKKGAKKAAAKKGAKKPAKKAAKKGAGKKAAKKAAKKGAKKPAKKKAAKKKPAKKKPAKK